jgi:hypothetical protein
MLPGSGRKAAMDSSATVIAATSVSTAVVEPEQSSSGRSGPPTHALEPEETFLLKQFDSLRKEIEDTKARIHRTLMAGVVVVPTIAFLSKAMDVQLIMWCLPILVVVIAVLYLSENHALMRAGQYILEHIEPKFTVCGWERWLLVHEDRGTRTVDKFLSIAFFTLFSFYYIISSAIAIYYVNQRFEIAPAAFLGGLYLAVGVVAVLFFKGQIKNAVATSRAK